MSHIPAWVYLLFFLLLYLGIKRCYTRVVSIERIAIIPVIFIFLSVMGTLQLFHFSLKGFLLLMAGSIFGFLIGHYLVRNRVIKGDKEKRLIEIPGDITMLIMVMAVFFIEFFIHYAMDAHWGITNLDIFRNITAFLNGLIVGISIGRSMTYFSKYMKSESINLNKS
ncbi:MAG: hypothetical protein A3F17_07715 [Gammaproteobacteria bacterium RIFCSPHIGHO2_12_FULL_41_15]|nr:MAG: hypothetical protein A3F17_07715 [Gammaproteobacteria bacterium RIFCSPHIGHO2_12_FULL_41_15]